MLQTKIESNQQRSLEESGAVGPGDQKVVVIIVGDKEHLGASSNRQQTFPCRITALLKAYCFFLAQTPQIHPILNNPSAIALV